MNAMMIRDSWNPSSLNGKAFSMNLNFVGLIPQRMKHFLPQKLFKNIHSSVDMNGVAVAQSAFQMLTLQTKVPYTAHDHDDLATQRQKIVSLLLHLSTIANDPVVNFPTIRHGVARFAAR